MSATESQIRAWLNDPRSGSSVYGRNWDQLCQALMWQVCNRFGNATRAYASANTARAASRINGTNPKDAPAGAFHYWEIGIYGHVALSLGGSRCLMGSRHVEQWARNVGVTTVEAYTRATGARYTGWSRTNGVNTIQIVTTTPGGGNVTPIPDQPPTPAPRLERTMLVFTLGRNNHFQFDGIDWLNLSEANADVAAKFYNPDGKRIGVTQAEYDRLVSIRDAAQANRDRAITTAAAPASSLKPVLDAIGKLPTAAQNGAAARTAIVK